MSNDVFIDSVWRYSQVGMIYIKTHTPNPLLRREQEHITISSSKGIVSWYEPFAWTLQDEDGEMCDFETCEFLEEIVAAAHPSWDKAWNLLVKSGFIQEDQNTLLRAKTKEKYG